MERLSWIIWVGPISLQVFFEGRARSFLVMEHLRIHCCHYSGPGHCCGGFDPWPGNLHMPQAQQRERERGSKAEEGDIMTEAEVGVMTLLALKWKGIMIQKKWASPRRWKNQERDSPLDPPERNQRGSELSSL